RNSSYLFRVGPCHCSKKENSFVTKTEVAEVSSPLLLAGARACLKTTMPLFLRGRNCRDNYDRSSKLAAHYLPYLQPRKAIDRSLYLPAGRWMSYNDKRTVYDGKVTILVPATLGVVPLFVA